MLRHATLPKGGKSSTTNTPSGLGEHCGRKHAPQITSEQSHSWCKSALLSLKQNKWNPLEMVRRGSVCAQERHNGLVPWWQSLWRRKKLHAHMLDFLPKPWASTTEHCTKGLTLPTMRRSVSGSCLKSFLKSSFRCLYVGLNTCK